jgi:hypothetical protein
MYDPYHKPQLFYTLLGTQILHITLLITVKMADNGPFSNI